MSVDLPFAQGLAAAASVAILTLGLAGPFLIADMKRLRRLAGATTRHLGVIRATGGLIHQLQRERGLSAGAKPGEIPAALEEQRRLVDRLLSDWRRDAEAIALSGRAAQTRDRAIGQITSLAPLRTLVAAGQSDFSAALAQFSTIIAGLLDMSAALVHASARGPSARQALAYGNLLRLKEAAGRERGTVAAALRAGRPVPRALCEELISAQALHLHQVELLAAPEIADRLRGIDSSLGREIAAIRSRLFTREERISPEEWFVVSTRRIDALKAAEDQLATLMTARATGFVDATRRQTGLARLAAGFGAAASFGMAVLVL